MCQPKNNGGLGLRDVRVANLSILAKWRWRLIQGDNGMWKDVLIEKYGRGFVIWWMKEVGVAAICIKMVEGFS